MSSSHIETRNFINGEYVESSSNERLTVRNPYNDSVVTSDVQVAGEAEIDAAVQAADAAYRGPWGKLPGVERAKLLLKLADLIERDAAEIAKLEVIGSGNAYQFVHGRLTPIAVGAIRHFAGWADKLEGSSFENKDGVYKIVRREPYGVVAGVASFNATLLYFSYKVGQSVAAGNCIIFKASEKTPLGAIALGKLVKEAGFPPGVIQIVSGGGLTGALLASHPKISVISFTGSPGVGKKVQELAAKSNLKKVLLELGGKNPCIIFDDADIDHAVQYISMGMLHNLGQVCVAGAKILVQRGIVDKFTAALAEAWTHAGNSLGGDPLDESTSVGTIIDKIQFDRVLGHIEMAKKDGTVVAGGDPFTGQGLFVKPTIVQGLSKDSSVYRDETFGPLVAIFPFDTEEEALDAANDTEFGLAANIYTENLDRVLRMSSSIDAGLVSVNMPVFPALTLPFGGFKQSGLGIEGGRWGVEEYTRLKAVMILSV
ncbi:aldehyde dehydrogenase [Thozetella sp. PMI_491]|nr:aldehyde dehydrogenase [Thozetella sp. PMI_491]